jgi:GDP-L-fucose synthase
MYKNKKVLVAGGAGLIGRQLVDLLLLEGAQVFVSDIRIPEDEFLKKISFKQLDLTDYENCVSACEEMDYVFNLLCAKGSPKVMKEKPASHFDPMLLFNTNLMRAAKECGVKKYLYTSTLGVYAPAPVFYEDDVWKTHPSENDRFAGWAKRMGELQAEAYQIQYDWNDISIVRPANTYGPHDDFDSDGAMVVPSLIKKVLSGDDEIIAWGDGLNVRDFIHSKDVARGMLIVMNEAPGPYRPVNLGSGTGYSIKELIEAILENVEMKPKIIWDTNRITGDNIRVLDIRRAESMGFKPEISLKEGIKDTMMWYINNVDRT